MTSAFALESVAESLVSFGAELCCPICRGIFDCPVSLPCTHCVCKACCAQLWGESNTAQCPSCRFEMTNRKQVKEYPQLRMICQYFKECTLDTLSQSQAPTVSQLVSRINSRPACLSLKCTEVVEDDDNNVIVDFPPAPALFFDATPQGDAQSSHHLVTPPTIRLPPSTVAAPSTPSPSSAAGLVAPSTPSPSSAARRNVEKETDEKKGLPPATSDPFVKGVVVTVKKRMGPGENKPGGVGKITRKYDDGFVDVRYTVEGGHEKHVCLSLLTLGMDVDQIVPSLNKTSPTRNSPFHATTDDTAAAAGTVTTPPPARKRKDGDSSFLPPPSTVSSRSVPKDPFRVGATVTVKKRMGPGENKPGGVGKIIRKHDDGFVDVQYTVEGGREKRVCLSLLTPGMDVDQIVVSKSNNNGKKNTSPTRVLTFTNTSQESPPHALSTAGRKNTEEQRPVTVVFTGQIAQTAKRTLLTTLTQLDARVLESKEDLDWSVVTHLVSTATTDELVTMTRTAKYLFALAQGGIWVVDKEWIAACRSQHRFVDESRFEIEHDLVSQQKGLPSGGPARSRTRMQPLFENWSMKFEQHHANLFMLESLARSCGARVVKEFESNHHGGDHRQVTVKESVANLDGQQPPMVGGEVVSVAWFLDCVACAQIIPFI